MLIALIDCPNRLARIKVGTQTFTKEKMALEKDAKVWSDKDYTIETYSKILNGGFFIQQPQILNNKNEAVQIIVTGSVRIYVATEKDRNGGYPQYLPQLGWKKEAGVVQIQQSKDLSEIFSLVSRFDKEKTITLPPLATDQTVMLIIAVPLCPGNFQCFHIPRLNNIHFKCSL